MSEFAILIIIFGFMVMLAGIYLARGNKGDFSHVLLWRSNVNKMKKEDIKYAGKVTISVALSIVVSGIIALFFHEESIIPLIILFVLVVSTLLISIRIFKSN